MKEINEMTLAEVEKEIKEFEQNRFKKNKKYVFVSYSHQNKEIVLRKVLEWIRYGYNIYIDYDFESHGSEENWVDIMYKTIRSNACVMAVCFRSEDYYYSYASLIELLTMRSKETTLDRRGRVLPIDILQLDAIEKTDDEFSSEEVEERYNILFEDLKQKMGEKFLHGKEAEEKLLISGLESIYELLKFDNVNKAMERLQRAYEDGVLDFYPQVANFMMAGFRVFDLNGNTKSVKSSGVISRFKKLGVYCAEAEKENVSNVSTPEKKKEIVLNEIESDITLTVEKPVENHNIELDWDNIEEFSDFDVDAEDVDTDFGENVDEDIFSQHTQEKKKFSLTGDIKYTLYGQQYEENQSDMMLRVFAQVLLRHEEVVATLPEQAGMNCVMRYEDIVAPNTKEAKPSYFRVCKEFKFSNGKSVCIGTAFSSGDKMKKIARLLEICEEDSDIFQSEQIQIPTTCKTRKGSSVVTYRLFGRSESGDQTEMMCNICKSLIDSHPEKLDELAENTLCITMNREEAIEKSYFRVSRAYFCNGREYIIGAAFNMAAKLKEIQKVFAICGEDIDDLQIEGYEFEKKEKQTRGRKKAEKNFFE